MIGQQAQQTRRALSGRRAAQLPRAANA